ncbi:MAG: NUDIX domain-containing protein [Pseudomonadota bacterium]
MGKIHGRKVQVVTLHQDGPQLKLLLLQTSVKRGSFWQNVTGKVEKGEALLAAAIRELQEETGIAAQLISLNYQFEFRNHWNEQVEEHGFLCLLKSPGPPEIKLDPLEHLSYRWVNTHQIRMNYYAFPTNFTCFQKAMEIIVSSGEVK